MTYRKREKEKYVVMCFAGNDLLCSSAEVLRKCIDGYFSCSALSVDLDFKKRIVIM